MILSLHASPTPAILSARADLEVPQERAAHSRDWASGDLRPSTAPVKSPHVLVPVRSGQNELQGWNLEVKLRGQKGNTDDPPKKIKGSAAPPTTSSSHSAVRLLLLKLPRQDLV